MSEVREGYKMTQLGEIPVEWEVKTLEEVAEVVMGQSPSSDSYNEIGEGVPFYQGKSEFGKKYPTPVKWCTKPTKLAQKGDILISVRAPVGELNICVETSCIGRGLGSIQSKSGENTFLYYVMENTKEALNKMGQGSTFTAINGSELRNVLIVNPQLKEQQKIASILSTVDEQIDQTEQLIVKTKELKKGLMQQLLTKGIGHTEFKQSELGEIPVAWEVRTVKELFDIRKEHTVDVKNNPLYSLTIESGLIEKPEQYERSFLLKNQEENQYALVRKNDIVINPMNLRFGAIAKANILKNVAVSAYYDVIFTTENTANVDFFIELFKSPKMIYKYNAVSTGTLLEKRRVHLSQFIKLAIPVPPIEEQNKIAEILSAVNHKIEIYEKEKLKYVELKKGLMQQLLTGKVRVNVEK